MKYYEANFNIQGPEAILGDARDLLSALAGEAGFETFEETAGGLTGYVQQTLLDQTALDALIAAFPMDGVTIGYTIGEAEDRDWNEQWEQQGFEPIVVGGRLVIHDGRHLPAGASDMTTVEIDARLAFGTGTHETTRMVAAQLLAMDLGGQRVLDCGCGTGILGIVALKQGAQSCTAYDIDEWSVDNTRHNAVINRVDQRLTTLHGDATLLEGMEERFGVIVANINRNILLADMPAFRSVMAANATLILSGFYTADTALITDRARELGLSPAGQSEDAGWACLTFRLG